MKVKVKQTFVNIKMEQNLIKVLVKWDPSKVGVGYSIIPYVLVKNKKYYNISMGSEF
jgi:hypothetical protein